MTQNLNSRRKRIRRNFGKIGAFTAMPNLIEMQKASYEKNFLQLGVDDESRQNQGLQFILNSIFPVTYRTNVAALEFIKYSFGTVKHSVDECIQRGLSYVVPLSIKLRLIVSGNETETVCNDELNLSDDEDSDNTVFDDDVCVTDEGGVCCTRNVEQNVYIGDLPMMTRNGTFVINGIERVIVSQMHRSPGVFFYHDNGHISGKLLYSARIIPYRGSWLDFEFDTKDILYFRIDKKRKLLATTMLYALGMSMQEIMDFYYQSVHYTIKHSIGWCAKFIPELVSAHRITHDLINADNGAVVLESGQKITTRLAKKLYQDGLRNVVIAVESLKGKFLARAIHASDIVIANIGDVIDDKVLKLIEEYNVTDIFVLDITAQSTPYMRNTLFVDKNHDEMSAFADIIKVLRPGESLSPSLCKSMMHNMFFTQDNYTLLELGRIKMNAKLKLNIDINTTCLTSDDIKYVLKLLIDIKNGLGVVDDIDHLGNRRVRSVGELLENQFRTSLIRMKRSIAERMSTIDLGKTMPSDLISPKSIAAPIKDLFTTSQFSQFMDQTNPLSEITHKRRLSSLGPGGLNRERAGLEVRDVHYTYYGRICPIETPEGPNIGLINSLATYAKVNKYGLIESPYRKVVNAFVTDEVVYLSAIEEESYKIAQADIRVDTDGKIIDEFVNCRVPGGHFMSTQATDVDFVDLIAMQVVSVAASLIPFLENDDASRALMGSNMQRQAVPLIKSEAPYVGTGVESVVASDSGATILAVRDGIVEQVDATRIVVRVEKVCDELPQIDIYNLLKFQKSNHNTCINQIPLVKVGDNVLAQQIIADGPSTDRGEIALGKNILVAFMSWNGYNFQDSIIVSEKVVHDDVFSSIHIVEFEAVVRDTRLGPEILTRDVINVSDNSIRNLDETGIVCIGAHVQAGDILVGKVTPKGESLVTPEEKLLRAIFGERAADVKDSSLYVPPGVSGTVIEVRMFARRGVEKDERMLIIEKQQIDKFEQDMRDELKIMEYFLRMHLATYLKNEIIVDHNGNRCSFSEIGIDEVFKRFIKKKLVIENLDIKQKVDEICIHFEEMSNNANKRFVEKVQKLQGGDDLQQGALKAVKVFIAQTRKLQNGDKMAGRHGNKGVVSRVERVENMPFLECGTAVDVILNPLGLPSRMNIGQILETHLGWASAKLGQDIGKLVNKFSNNDICIDEIKSFVTKIYNNDKELCNAINNLSTEEMICLCNDLKDGIYFATPVFNGARAENIKSMLELAGLHSSGQVKLIDGKTGEFFDRKITVGYQYLLKLHHLVDDKIHARSTGPYSLVTQQPLSGKSFFGGQRLGEMECWALEAYGASHLLREMLTVKSDDIYGRTAVYEKIAANDVSFKSGTPESFNVMITEMRSLNIQVDLLRDNVPIPLNQNYNKGFHRAFTTHGFDSIRVSIASPEVVRSWSFGEVKKPETINYRTFKPESDGLFCARIFGPVKDYECICGKYKRIRNRGTTCEKCGVEVTTSKVRRERMGHIELATPIAHTWFCKSLPSRVGLLLDLAVRDLEKILYFESYVVIDPGITSLTTFALLSEDSVQKLYDEYSNDAFTVATGAEAVQMMLKSIDLNELKRKLQNELAVTNSETKRKKSIKRLRLVEDFINSGNKPEWMIVTVLPVIPPDIRPLVMLDGGRFATSDLNELYRRVINRNNRLKRLLEMNAPDVIIKNEKRMLQEAVDALFDNGRRSKSTKDSRKRPLKSLADMLKGKTGRFRQNLLGKRVDYSGRSVIVVGPELKLYQCGLPKKMALELFKPFIYAKLMLYGIASTIRAAKRIVETESNEVWDILDEVTCQHPVLLNRAPSLHRLSIQAFEPVLIEGKAIQLHPLVCAAFNADFDGDQMAVHVPLSIEAQIEARVLMMSSSNVLSPASGRPIIGPESDMVLGLYYLTIDNGSFDNIVFCDANEVCHALFHKFITIHTLIKFRYCNNDGKTHIVTTTAGRLELIALLPNRDIGFDLINKAMTKKDIFNLIDVVYRLYDMQVTATFADNLMQLGFKHATLSGISFGMHDVTIPDSKVTRVAIAKEDVKMFEAQYREGLITNNERRNKIIDTWTKCTDSIANDVMQEIAKPNSGSINSIYLMITSGARGSAAQVKQLAGMRGLMVKPSGEIMDFPIISNFLEGLTVLEYFYSTHGGRKGLADTALKTANSGYLTRRLVDVAQDIVITEFDCNTNDSIEVRAVITDGEITVALTKQILGRVAANDIFDSEHVIVHRGELITESIAQQIEDSGADVVHVRSALTCGALNGVCAKCYGRDLATGSLISIGEAVGIIAAQSIGEPGTQLTLKTFHIGGTATTKVTEASSIVAPYDGYIKIINCSIIIDSNNKRVVINRLSEITFVDSAGNERFKKRIPHGAKLNYDNGSYILKGTVVVEWNPYATLIIAEKSGRVVLYDIVNAVSCNDVVDEITGIVNKVITDFKARGADLQPRICLMDDNNQISATYYLPINTVLSVGDSVYATAGDILASIPKQESRKTTRDIVGGLPRVVELVEARRPKNAAIIAETDGTISFGKDYKAKRKLILNPDDGSREIEYIISKGKYITVGDGDFVKKGDMLVDGHYVLHDILRILGVKALMAYIVEEIQAVYRLQGVNINDKHVEIIVRCMLKKVQIVNPGDSQLSIGDVIDYTEFVKISNDLCSNSVKPIAEPVLNGITQASLRTGSFISAASFQDTSRVLIGAAVSGKVDKLEGLKENVITGRLIPAGTGFIQQHWKSSITTSDSNNSIALCDS